MKKLIAAVALFTLVGCAGPKFTDADVSLENSRMLSRNSCVDARARGEAARVAAIAQMDPAAQPVALMAEAMRAQAEALAGKSDPCATGMSAHEARARIAASQNEAATGLVSSVVRGSIIGLGIVEGADVLKDAIKNSGDKVSIAGDGNSYGQERVTSDATITTKNVGDGTATSGAPTVAGPDKSTSTTIEAPPEPELPEVEEPEGEFVPTEPPDFPDGPVEIPGPEAAE